MKIKNLVLLLVITCIVLCYPSLASDNQREEFFFGVAKIINLNSNSQTDQFSYILVKKTTIPGLKLIIEKATTVDSTGKMKDHIVSMKVSGNNLKISDAENSIEGTGTVYGTPWDWKTLKFSMRTKKSGIRIEDWNYRTEDSLIARKVLSLPNGVPFMLWEVDAKEISRLEYLKTYMQMHKGILVFKK